MACRLVVIMLGLSQHGRWGSLFLSEMGFWGALRSWRWAAQRGGRVECRRQRAELVCMCTLGLRAAKTPRGHLTRVSLDYGISVIYYAISVRHQRDL